MEIYGDESLTKRMNDLAGLDGSHSFTYAANVFAGTNGLSAVAALNVYAGTDDLSLPAVLNNIAGTNGLSAPAAARSINV